jgi:hypothetical protein
MLVFVSQGHSQRDQALTVFDVFSQDLSYQKSWSWFLKPRAQAKEKKLLENFHAVRDGSFSAENMHQPSCILHARAIL